LGAIDVDLRTRLAAEPADAVAKRITRHSGLTPGAAGQQFFQPSYQLGVGSGARLHYDRAASSSTGKLMSVLAILIEFAPFAATTTSRRKLRGTK
jgi:hypothetical protein